MKALFQTACGASQWIDIDPNYPPHDVILPIMPDLTLAPVGSRIDARIEMDITRRTFRWTGSGEYSMDGKITRFEIYREVVERR